MPPMRPLALATLLAFAIFASPVFGQAPNDAHRLNAEARARLRPILAETVDTTKFKDGMPLKDAIGLFDDYFRAKGTGGLPIIVNDEAFKKVKDVKTEASDTQVKLEPPPNMMTVATALRLMLSQIK